MLHKKCNISVICNNKCNEDHLQLKFETTLRSVRLIVWPQDVSEVIEVKMKKILGENPKITDF